MLGSFLDITTMMITNRGDGRSPECSPDRPEAEPPEAAARSERILVLVPGGADAALIREVLTRARLKYSLCADMDELCAQMHSDAGAVLLAEEVLDPSVMQRLVEIVGQQPPWSDFPFAVLFGQVGRSPEVALRMLDLFEPLGNVHILERPLSPTSLVSALRTALRARRRQYQVRDLLLQQKQAIRHRERFLSMLAHELRDPLGSIRHATEILERLGPKTNQGVEQRNRIARQTARLARLIDNVLDVSQLLIGKLTLRWGTVDLGELVQRTLRALAAEMDQLHVQVSYAPPKGPVVVEGDSERLGKALLDLLTHMMVFTPPGGRIELNLTQRGPEGVIQLRGADKTFATAVLANLADVPVEENQVLEPHPQAALKIGLTVVSKVVELHEGSIAVAEPADDDSALELRLPLRSVAAAPAREAPSAEQRKEGPRRVLIIEDNADYRESLRMLLQMWGHQTSVVGTPGQGIQQALQDKPEVVMVDIGLPGMDGYEVARRIRASLGAGPVLLAMTGYGPPHDARRAREAGFDMHLVKPVDPVMLQGLLRAPEAMTRKELV
jgi:signal transduction histidine kinase/CheY-like chemotaxis protein